jgi:hypothetical protein
MYARKLIILALAGAIVAGCSGNALRSWKDDSWSQVSPALSDGRHISNPSLPTLSKLPDPQWVGVSPVPNNYGHPFRPLAFVLQPIGVALDYALMRPFYMLGGLAPEWFGLTSDDAQGYQGHMPEFFNSKDAPRRFD